MKIEHNDRFKNSLKKIKKKFNELDMYEKIVNHMLRCNDFNEFKKNPISRMYGFEQLKYDLNCYYSCNLNKNGGTDRLIFSTDDDKLITLEYVSIDHYEDFKKIIRGK